MATVAKDKDKERRTKFDTKTHFEVLSALSVPNHIGGKRARGTPRIAEIFL